MMTNGDLNICHEKRFNLDINVCQKVETHCYKEKKWLECFYQLRLRDHI